MNKVAHTELYTHLHTNECNTFSYWQVNEIVVCVFHKNIRLNSPLEWWPILLNVNSLFIFQIKQQFCCICQLCYKLFTASMPTPSPPPLVSCAHTYTHAHSISLAGCLLPGSSQSINQLISQSNLLWRHIKINEWVRMWCGCEWEFGPISKRSQIILHKIHVCRCWCRTFNHYMAFSSGIMFATKVDIMARIRVK